MAQLSTLSQTSVDKAKEISEKVRALAQTATSNALESILSGVGKTQEALMAQLSLGQQLLKNNEKKAQKNLMKAQKNIAEAQEQLQSRWEQASTPPPTSTGLNLAQGLFLEAVQQWLSRNNLKKLQGSVQENLEMSREKAQDALSQGSQKASKRILQAASSAIELKDMMQDRYESYRRSRKRAQYLFRGGLLIGFVLILLYTPLPGSEIRSRLAMQWQQYRSSLGI